MEKMECKVGDFGHFKFMSINNNGMKRYIDCYGEVLYAHKKFILILDNDGHPHLILRDRLEYFKAEVKKCL